MKERPETILGPLDAQTTIYLTRNFIMAKILRGSLRRPYTFTTLNYTFNKLFTQVAVISSVQTSVPIQF